MHPSAAVVSRITAMSGVGVALRLSDPCGDAPFSLAAVRNRPQFERNSFGYCFFQATGSSALSSPQRNFSSAFLSALFLNALFSKSFSSKSAS